VVIVLGAAGEEREHERGPSHHDRSTASPTAPGDGLGVIGSTSTR
jgi:hypothetical protein